MTKTVEQPVSQSDIDLSIVKENNAETGVANMQEGTNEFELQLAKFARFADVIANSPTYNGAYITFIKGEDGKDKEVVDKNAIVASLVLGEELGFSPMQSIMLGRKLDSDAIIKVEYAKTLGLNVMSALENVYVWEQKGKKIVYTGIHVVNAVLSKHGITKNIIEDGSKKHIYYVAATGDCKGEVFERDEIDNTMFVLSNDAKVVEENLRQGKIGLLRHVTRRAIVELKRGDETVAVPYTLVQATEADLYKGKKADGTEVKGKDNWNNHPEDHLRKMSIMKGARLIASDLLHGIYLAEEVSFVKDTERYKNAEDVEAEIIPD